MQTVVRRGANSRFARELLQVLSIAFAVFELLVASAAREYHFSVIVVSDCLQIARVFFNSISDA